MKKIIYSKVTLVTVFIFCFLFTVNSQSLNQGRVAVIADGNFRDPDDIAATPVSLAILKAYGLEKKLVHYSHSCDLKRGSGDAGGAFREEEMQIGCDGTASRWGGFDHITFYNAFRDQQETIDDLANHINDSSINDPLWIVLAGETDILYEAVLKANSPKRKFVYIISHHTANERGDFHDLDDIVALGAIQHPRIPNQNDKLKKDLSTWHWARDHNDERIKWLWERGFVAQTDAVRDGYNGIRGDFDCSDAGMVYYWATLPTGGDKNCDIPKLKNLFLDYVDSGINNQPLGSFTAPTVESIEEGYDELYVLVEASDPDNDAITSVTLYIDGTELRREGQAPYEWGAPGQRADETLGLTPGEHLLEAIITDSRGASTTISKTIMVTDSTLSVSEVVGFEDKHILSLYPNPVQNMLIISGNTAGKSIKIYDVSGTLKMIKDLNKSEDAIDVSTFSSGLYLARITNLKDPDSKSSIYKFLKIN